MLFILRKRTSLYLMITYSRLCSSGSAISMSFLMSTLSNAFATSTVMMYGFDGAPPAARSPPDSRHCTTKGWYARYTSS